MANAVIENDMYVIKRSGELEVVSFDKILKRIKNLCNEANIKINYTALAMKVIDQLYDKISATKIDELTSEQCASMSSIHPDYNTLAGRVVVSNNHKNIKKTFSETMMDLYNFTDKDGNHSPLVSEEFIKIVKNNAELLDKSCEYSRDYLIDYFGFKTLERAYLMRINKNIVERVQHMWMRVSIGIHFTNIDRVLETYNYMSQKYFTHATPTLFNSGTPRPQMSSCFLLSMEDDSIEGIFNTLKDCAMISKWAGGIGLHIHNVRASGTHIRGTNGTSNGIVPMLKVFNNTAKYVDQCVLPNTIIYTKNGPTKIMNCVSNITEIFNINGETEVIDNVLEHSYDGDILKISTINNMLPRLSITPQHPVLVLENHSENNQQTITNELDRNLASFSWRDASDIKRDDLLVYSIPNYEKDYEKLTEDVCYYYGLLLAGISRYYRFFDVCSPDSNLNFFYYVGTYDECDVIAKYFDENSVEYKIRTCSPSHPEYKYIQWNKSVNIVFRTTDFFDPYYTVSETPNKLTISERWLFLPKNKILQILRGLGKEASYADIANRVFFMNLRLGELKDFTKQDNTEIGFKYKNFVMLPVKSVEKKKYIGTVYDLQMKKDHNYMLETGLVHNGGGKRNGSFAIYLEPWHSDIELFLQMRKNHGDEELKARDLFYALWIPDLFMERIKTNGKWTLMCPEECKGLSDVHSEEFVKLYTKYESEGKGRKTMNARDLWFQILDAQMETGTPYILFKDACNKKSNQKNLGTIKSSNLCVAPETVILTDKGHKEIQTLVGKQVNVWNGEEFSEVTIRQTFYGRGDELIDIYTTDGMKLSCTKYHKFHIKNHQEGAAPGLTLKVEAKNLSIGDELINWAPPVIDGEYDIQEPYLNGVCSLHLERSSNLTFNFDGSNELIIPSSHKAILDHIPHVKSTKQLNVKFIEDNKRIDVEKYIAVIDTNNLQKNEDGSIFVPNNHTMKTKMEWFSGLYDMNAFQTTYGFMSIEIPCYDFGVKVKYMLQTCGVNAYICNDKDKQDSYILGLLNSDYAKLKELGFAPRIIPIRDTWDIKSGQQRIAISKIVHKGKRDITFCFSEPKKHLGIFNGMIAGNCTEIIQYSDDKESAVCNLASIALPSFIDMTTSPPSYDYEKLHKITKIVSYNLNRVIDANFYPTEKTKRSNMRHRPIGIGVQGLADVFMKMGLSFISDEAKEINKNIFETIYHAALEESCELAQIEGKYETFDGSPASQGILQFDMWNVDPTNERYNWSEIKENIMKHGLRNSLLLAPMPTASTSQILGFNECIEPVTSNIYSRKTIAGEFVVINKYLMNDFIELDLWNEKIKNNIIANNGSIQHLEMVPQEIRERYRTVWELPMKHIIDMAADRGAFICQSQSLNLWIEDPTYNTLTSMHFYSWSKGLKTGIYYLRRRSAHKSQQFTIEPEKKLNNEEDEDEICLECGS